MAWGADGVKRDVRWRPCAVGETSACHIEGGAPGHRVPEAGHRRCEQVSLHWWVPFDGRGHAEDGRIA